MDNEFNRIVYDIIREIPPGKVISYGQIASLAGQPNWSRKVGRALSHVPSGLDLPCHRVVNSQGRLAPGWAEQRILLESEGVVLKPNGCVDLRQYGWKLFDIE